MRLSVLRNPEAMQEPEFRVDALGQPVQHHSASRLKPSDSSETWKADGVQPRIALLTHPRKRQGSLMLAVLTWRGSVCN